jgi:hypothetical protein
VGRTEASRGARLAGADDEAAFEVAFRAETSDDLPPNSFALVVAP